MATGGLTPNLPPVPREVKFLAHVLKVAEAHDERNIVISYWARMYVVQTTMKLIRGPKSPELTALLTAILGWLEDTKKQYNDNDGIANETVAHAIVEKYAIQMFKFADSRDQIKCYNKGTIKAFFTAGILIDMLEQFEELPQDLEEKRKYAKWKAANIHECLKTGETPLPGGQEEQLGNVIDISKDPNELPTSTIHRSDYIKDDTTIFHPPPGAFITNEDEEEFLREQDNAAGLPGTSEPNGGHYPRPSQPSPQTPSDPPSVSPPTPAPRQPSISNIPSASTQSRTTIDPDVVQKAQKYCKFAASALNYDDVKTAIDNLTKALDTLAIYRE